MSDETENQGPQHVTMFRIVPQLKTFEKGTLLKTKQDLYFSLEEDVVETGGDDNWSPLINVLGGSGTPGTHGIGTSFSQSADFLHKEKTVMFVEAAQFRASDERIYVRAQLLSQDQVVWVNIVRVPVRKWGYMIKSEQKDLIKNELQKMFEIL